jgi:hypothetical protein
MCTANKVTHLFAHDVYNTTPTELPDNFWLWESNLTNQFSTMTANLLANITNKHKHDLPVHSQFISNISVNEGGLGIQNLHTNAITAYMTTTKTMPPICTRRSLARLSQAKANTTTVNQAPLLQLDNIHK